MDGLLLSFPEEMPFFVELNYLPKVIEVQVVRVNLFPVVVNIHNFQMLLMHAVEHPFDPLLAILFVK